MQVSDLFRVPRSAEQSFAWTATDASVRVFFLRAQVCGAIFRMDSNGNGPGVRYVHEHPEVLFTLFRGYDNPAIALNCGSMLRDCIRDESLAQCVPFLFTLFFFNF